MLINFYNSDFFTFGILAGFGVGGAYFDSPAFKTYQGEWDRESQYLTDLSRANVGKIYKHHLSATLSAGVRFNIFQKIRNEGKRVCSNRNNEGRRVCRVPITRLEHSIELNTKFSLMTYRATDSADIFGGYCGTGATWNNGGNNTDISGQYLCLYRDKPGYEVKNPYKFTVRYIFAF